MGESFVVNGAMMTCTFGLAPSSLIVLPARTKQIGNMPRANIMDFAPMVNIMPFGMCNTLSNPVVAAATAAKLGVFTPAACIPAVTAPWIPGSPQSMVQGQPALTNTSQCICMWGGVIRFTNDGQMPGIPPIVVPMPNIPILMPNPGKTLSQEELEQLSEEEQEAYEAEMREAQKAGATDLDTAAKLDEMAKRYREEHTPEGLEKALRAEKLSRDYKLRAAQKQAEAMNNVSEKYRGNEIPNKENLSKQELQDIYDNKWKESKAKQKEIDQLDRELEKKSADFDKKQDNLKKANDEMLAAHKPWYEAKQEKEDAAKKRQLYESEAEMWRNGAANAKTEEDRQYFQSEAERMDALAKQSEKKEAEAAARQKAAEPAFNKASDKQKKAANEYRESLNSWSETNDKKKAAEAEKKEIDDTKYAALGAMNAQHDMQQHDAAVARHEEAKADTREKGQNAAVLKKEEDQYRNAADQSFKAATEAREWGNQQGYDADKGENVFYDMSIEQTAEFDRRADTVAEQRREADKAYQESRENLHEAYEDAYGDDALLKQYSAEYQYDKEQDILRGQK